MADNPIPIDRFLTELRASLSQSNSAATLRRINAERVLQLVLEEVVEGYTDDRIRVLPDDRMAGDRGVDLLLQVDEYDIRLQLVDAPNGVLELAIEDLLGFKTVLEENPNTVALIVTWCTDDLDSVALGLSAIESLQEDPGAIPRLLDAAKPVAEVVAAVLERQVKAWGAGLDLTFTGEIRTIDTRRQFETTFATAVAAERKRSYRTPERKSAAEQYPTESEKHLVMAVLEAALQDASIDELTSKLTGNVWRGDE